MNIRKHSQRIASLTVAALFSLLTARAALSAPLNIADVPLNLTTGVKPNLIMAIDDSGSMDFELLLPGNDGAAWWRTNISNSCDVTGVHSFTGCVANGSTDLPGVGRPNFNNSGNASSTWKKFAYLFPNGSGGNTEDRRRLADSTHDHYAIPPIPAFGWTRSAEYNRAYFDPTEVYTPWPNNGSYTFTDADPTAAEFDPVFNGYGTINLTEDFAGQVNVPVSEGCVDGGTLGNISGNYGFRVYFGMTIPAGTCIRVSGRGSWELVRSTGCQVGVANGCLVTTTNSLETQFTLNTNTAIGIRYFPATFYASSENAPPAGFGYIANPANDGLAPDGSTMYRYEIKPENFSSTEAYNAAIQNFANWFSYYRKRHQALRAGLGRAFETLSGWNVAGFTINSASTTGPNVTMGDIDDAATRTALYANFYQSWVRSGGTPNRTAVANIIRNYRRGAGDAGRPIRYSCQRNFGMLFTDGFSNPPESGDGINGVYGNIDSGRGAPYQDGTSATMADAVMYGYVNNLRPDLPTGRVPLPAACSDTNPDPRLDCNANLHMNFYAVTLNTRGLLFNPDNLVDPYTTPPTWPTSFPARHPSAVDDIWHATINGRGKLLNASSSTELADKLEEVLNEMEGEVGSASSAAVSTGSVTSDTRLFQARYDSEDWSGSLSARRVEMDGTLLSEVFSTVPTPAARQIITVNSNGTPVPFDWDDLDVLRQGELQPDSDDLGEQRLAWLRGDRSLEGTTFRERGDVLGDIVNSAPVFVGAPNFRYPDNLESAPYSAFRATHLNRTHMVYVGANDGMLHGFYSDDTAANGVVQERFAFIPGGVFKLIYQLTYPTYEHRYYVDGSPVVGDAFVNGAWRTMLVGGLNAGGQSIYALDVTDPSSLTEANAASVFRWEFTDANDVDLGFTYARPSIVRMNNGQWAAVFGNGYNNTVNDGRASTTGNAVLYIVNLATGALIRKIDTGVGTSADPTGSSRPNGLSTPVLADTDGDYDVDVAYAGDLYGNLWKFDLSSTAPASWVVAYSGVPLFRARDADVGGNAQPITSRPNVANGPGGQGLVVVFGTGKYLETSDTLTSPTRVQSFYGLFDPNTGADSDRIASRANLLRQSIWVERTGETFTDADGNTFSSDVRVVTDLPILATHRGWYLDLRSPAAYEAEKAVTDALIRDNRYVTFTTTVPNNDPCESGGSSWLMELDLFNGGRTDLTPWDMNRDGEFDQRDQVTVGGVVYPVNGIRNPAIGIIPRPAVLASEDCEFLIFPGTSGGTDSRCRNPGPRGFGRQSWRQAQ